MASGNIDVRTCYNLLLFKNEDEIRKIEGEISRLLSIEVLNNTPDNEKLWRDEYAAKLIGSDIEDALRIKQNIDENDEFQVKAAW